MESRLSSGMLVAFSLLVAHAACDREFPVQPTPTANTPVTTLSGTTYSGTVVINGTATPFNMTLIARALGVTTLAATRAQAPNTVEVTGNFETVTGLRGTIDGDLLQGTLENGQFMGDLHATASTTTPACTRTFSGPVAGSGVLWSPTGVLTTGCPLTFPIEVARTTPSPCTYSLAALPASFTASGGNGTFSVTTASECGWRPESLAPWLVLGNLNARVGDGTTPFTAQPNTAAAPRLGQLRVAGQTLSISQAGTSLPTGSITLMIFGSGTLRIPADPLSPTIAVCQGAAGGQISCAGIQLPAGPATIRATAAQGWEQTDWAGCASTTPADTCSLTIGVNQTPSVSATFRPIIK